MDVGRLHYRTTPPSLRTARATHRALTNQDICPDELNVDGLQRLQTTLQTKPHYARNGYNQRRSYCSEKLAPHGFCRARIRRALCLHRHNFGRLAHLRTSIIHDGPTMRVELMRRAVDTLVSTAAAYNHAVGRRSVSSNSWEAVVF